MAAKRPCLLCGHGGAHPGKVCEEQIGRGPSLHACGCDAVWQPHAGPQERFVTTSASEVLYGGAAGGGKSGGLIAIPIYWLRHRNFLAVILRRETTQLGDLIAKSHEIYPHQGGRAVHEGASLTWKFPSGARIHFSHCQHLSDVERFDGWEISVLGFDELTHFEEAQYVKIRARIRSPNVELPLITRSTTNPGGPGHAWVFARWGPWLDPDFKAPGLTERNGLDGARLPPAASGQVLHYVRVNDQDVWVPKGTLDGDGNKAKSRTFIAAKLEDNPSIDASYKATLNDLDRVRRQQLKDGNWLVVATAGELFEAGWFEIVDAKPGRVVSRVRVWDRAATKPSADNPDPDWTRGLLISRDSAGLYYLEDMASCRDRPAAVEQLMKTTAELDGRGVPIIVFQDPGSAGVSEADATVVALAGWTIKVLKIGKSDGDKVTRARPASAQAERRNIKLVRGMWNKSFLEEVQAFPTNGVHDDQVDVLSTGVSAISPTSAAARFALLSQL